MRHIVLIFGLFFACIMPTLAPAETTESKESCESRITFDLQNKDIFERNLSSDPDYSTVFNKLKQQHPEWSDAMVRNNMRTELGKYKIQKECAKLPTKSQLEKAQNKKNNEAEKQQQKAQKQQQREQNKVNNKNLKAFQDEIENATAAFTNQLKKLTKN